MSGWTLVLQTYSVLKVHNASVQYKDRCKIPRGRSRCKLVVSLKFTAPTIKRDFLHVLSTFRTAQKDGRYRARPRSSEVAPTLLRSPESVGEIWESITRTRLYSKRSFSRPKHSKSVPGTAFLLAFPRTTFVLESSSLEVLRSLTRSPPSLVMEGVRG